jgi:hypothetical protein
LTLEEEIVGLRKAFKAGATSAAAAAQMVASATAEAIAQKVCGDGACMMNYIYLNSIVYMQRVGCRLVCVMECDAVLLKSPIVEMVHACTNCLLND